MIITNLENFKSNHVYLTYFFWIKIKFQIPKWLN